MNKLKRPLAIMVLWFIIGIIGGETYLEEGRFFLLFLVLAGIGLLIFYFYYQLLLMGIACVFLILGAVCPIIHPVVKEKDLFLPDEVIVLDGTAEKIAEGEFNQTMTLGAVLLKTNDEAIQLRSKVNVRITKRKDVTLQDRLRVSGKVTISQKMNPSDKDYEKYLMSKNIAGTIQASQCEVISGSRSKIKIRSVLKQQIGKIFNNKDKGIISTLLIGESEDIPEDIYRVYTRTGIGHVLSISGFHIALLSGVLYFLLGYFGVPYTPRYLMIGGMLWTYAFFTGASTSTVRACIMATLIILARCIWEEEDLWTNLALAAAIILFINPFQLQQPGFQLSFGAVGCLAMSQFITTILEDKISIKYHRVIRFLIPWFCVTLGTYPILAFHFYEIPLLCTLINLFLIPLFSMIIIGAWLCLAISLLNLSVAVFCGKLIIFFLSSVVWIGNQMLHMPLGTFCTGAPSLVGMVCYYVTLGAIGLLLAGKIKRETVYWLSVLFFTLYFMSHVFISKRLEVAYLYVGQGDGIMITSPEKKVMLIDGGNFGKGKVIENYIKYKGKKTVEAMILSHSDADHIGGFLDLMETDIKVKNLFVSEADHSELLWQLIKKCKEKKVKIYRVGVEDTLHMGQLEISCLAPKTPIRQADNNNNSIGCRLSYKRFSVLFTGDMNKEKEREMCKDLKKTTVVKISHHGSKTGTSEEVLLKIRPQYAIISCGINNRYGHPNGETLETLQKYPIKILRTDKNGAIRMLTDGKKISICTQIKGNQ